MGVWETIVKALMPPKVGATEEQLYAWRIIMITLDAATAFLLVTHLMWIAGAVPYFEGEALAKRSEVQALATVIQEDRKEDLVIDLVNLRRDQCKSTGQARDLYREKIQTKLEEYKDLHSRTFNLPDCDDYSE